VSSAGAYDSHVRIDAACAVDVSIGLLTFCAARGDVFAVLGAPAALDEEDVLAFKADVVGRFLARDDRRTPSFGALYYPWLIVGQDSAGEPEPRPVAPAGPVCGLIAARTLEHGAWYAPANRPLAGVVSTVRPLDRASWAALDRAHVNAVILQPHGFVTLGAHTLTPDTDLEEISVRRFLSLLRRLALREGPSLVFEPHGPDLRRGVRRQFERVLNQLFVRGALAGRNPGEAFQVVVDDTNNPPQSVDAGRLVVELRVAPSRPLAFLVVRFMLRGGGTAGVETA
jgi:phage tail sheath protein FI